MTYNQPETPERNAVPPKWWTPERTRLASLCGFVGGLGGLAVTGFVIGPTGLGGELGVTSLFYPVSHALIAIALLAANAWYGYNYGGGGRSIAVLLALSLVCYAGSTVIVYAAGPITLGDLLIPIGILTGAAYMSIRLFGSIYGIYLWRKNGQSSANRLTSSLFVILLPSVFVLALVSQLGLPGWVINAPLYLAFIALSYGLWTVEAGISVRSTGREES